MFYLDHLSMEGFRNYGSQLFSFNPKLNIICGANAQGKTNLLESIFFISVNRSFRTRKEQELVNFKGDGFSLKGNYIKDCFKHAIQINYRHNSRLSIKANNDQVNRYDCMPAFPTIVFSPEDLKIVSEGPSIRRRFLNLEASRLDITYLKDLRDYQRVLNQRNKVLKQKSNINKINDYLSPWDRSLTNLGVKLIRSRVEMIKALQKEAKVIFNQLSDTEEELSLEYESTIRYFDEPEEMEEQFYNDLLNNREQELKRYSTLLGPHLDDLNIKINGNSTRVFASQGQKRTAALALRMGEVGLYMKQNSIPPILLLDDVFSEFDADRKQHLLSFLRNYSGQCFLTSAVDLDTMVNYLNKSYKKIIIKQGSIIDETVGTGD